MASFSYIYHPNNNYPLPLSISAGSARYWVYYSTEYVSSLTSISVSHSISGSSYSVWACWTDSAKFSDPGPYHYDERNHSSSAIMIINGSNMNTLKSSFNKARQYLVIRVGNTSSSNITVNSFTVTANGT